MNPISTEFAAELNDSPWMGTVYEAGFGIPFQYHYLNIPGASRTILQTKCDYNKAFQPVLVSESGKFQRSVSHQMVTELTKQATTHAYSTLVKDIDRDHAGNSGLTFLPPIFALAVSGAQSGIDARGASHGWVSLSTFEDGTFSSYAFHFFNHKQTKTWVEDEDWFPVAYDAGMPPDGHWEYHDVTRSEAGDELVRFIQWFMEKVLLGKYDSWGEAIKSMPKSDIIRINVIRADDISIEEHLGLCSADTPLVYDGGEFKRPVDYLRKYSKIYRGSFNPITLTHDIVGDGALFEIALNNIRKARVSESDIAMRLSEVTACGHPVLITDDLPAFVQLDELLTSRGGKSFEYIVGMDTFNAIVSDKYNPYPNYLSRFHLEGGRSMFIVVPRDDIVLTGNERTSAVNWVFFGEEYDPTISSTRVRAGELDLVPEPARALVAGRLGFEHAGILSFD